MNQRQTEQLQKLKITEQNFFSKICKNCIMLVVIRQLLIDNLTKMTTKSNKPIANDSLRSTLGNPYI